MIQDNTLLPFQLEPVARHNRQQWSILVHTLAERFKATKESQPKGAAQHPAIGQIPR